MRGPASVLFGQVNPGGLISMTSKRPTSQPIHEVQFRTGNNHLAEGAFDVGGTLSDDGHLLYRLNGIARTQNNQIDDYKETRMAIAPALTWYPNDATSAANSSVLSRRAQHEQRQTDEFGIDNQLEAQFASGQVAHTVIGGVDYKTSKDKQYLGRAGGSQYDIDWRSPSYGVNVDESAFSPATNELQNLDQAGVYVQDHNKFTWRTGLLYAFDSGLSPYISYSTSFEPNLQTNRAPGVGPFDPSEGKQVEVGLKYQPDPNALMTLALYDLTQSNVATYNSAAGWFENSGKVRSKGVEAEAHATVFDNLNLIASYTYTDAETVNTTVVGTEGKTPARIPTHMASAFTSYTLPDGALKSLTAGVGVRYIGTSYGDAKNTFKVPAVDLYDAMVSYELGELNSSLKGAKVQFNVNNLANTKYVASCASDSACFYGIGRTVTATVNYAW